MKQSRLLPITIASVICFFTAFLLGAGFWYFFGSGKLAIQESNVLVKSDNSNSVNSNVAAPIANANVKKVPVATPEIKKAPAGEIEISAGESTLGGGKLQLPLKRVSVDAFSIGETEVTNEQYAEFIKAGGKELPDDWKDGTFPNGEEDMPVVGVTWHEANSYCEWLSTELGTTVRLPSEAEWERAARGDTDYKYPWGNKWNNKAASFGKKKPKIYSVKSFPEGRSPFGVYEMISNVWEWTSDLVVDKSGEALLHEKSKQRIAKGGSVGESEIEFMSIDNYGFGPENTASKLLGFRYVVIRGN